MEINSVADNTINNTELNKLKKACTDFEAIFYNMIFQLASKSPFKSDLIKKSNGEKIFTDMLNQQYAELTAKNTKGGIKDMLFNSFKDSYERLKFADELENKAGKTSISVEI